MSLSRRDRVVLPDDEGPEIPTRRGGGMLMRGLRTFGQWCNLDLDQVPGYFEQDWTLRGSTVVTRVARVNIGGRGANGRIACLRTASFVV